MKKLLIMATALSLTIVLGVSVYASEGTPVDGSTALNADKVVTEQVSASDDVKEETNELAKSKGTNYVDKDNDGVCDNYNGSGAGNGNCDGTGAGNGNCDGTGNGNHNGNGKGCK